MAEQRRRRVEIAEWRVVWGEQGRPQAAERLVRLLSVFRILSWRVFWLTMLNRIEPHILPARVLTRPVPAAVYPLARGRGCMVALHGCRARQSHAQQKERLRTAERAA